MKFGGGQPLRQSGWTTSHSVGMLQSVDGFVFGRSVQGGQSMVSSVMIAPEADRSTPWRTATLAGLANYVDAGSIVAISSSLTLWVDAFGLTPDFVGLIGALGANAISAGVGALIGGRLCDRFGRKRVFVWDMFFYAFGMSWLVFATQPWMLLLGAVLVGLAVGADIPASWSLIAETAPPDKRGRYGSVAQALWVVGPMVVLLLFIVLLPLELLGARIIFAHLALMGVALALLRSRMVESRLWEEARATRNAEHINDPGALGSGRIRELLSPQHLRAILFLVGFYGIWNLFAGTNSFYFQYMLTTVAEQTALMSLSLRGALGFVFLTSLYFMFTRLSDRVNQRALVVASSLIQVFAVSLLALFPLTTGLIVAYGLLMAFSSAFGQQPFYQLWSAEFFPTLLRATAQGLTFAIVRIGLGIWSFAVPMLMATHFKMFIWIMAGFLGLSGLIAWRWAPRHEGKSLEQIQADRAAIAKPS
jgi:inositol transporter-like SP family MFS transporter